MIMWENNFRVPICNKLTGYWKNRFFKIIMANEEAEEFTVEKVLDKRVGKNGKVKQY